jgi:hypothetical protein
MTIAHFTVVYDGEALLTNRMDVRDLGPALMSLGQLFDEANRVLNDNKTEIRLNVRATAAGSFQVDFELTQSLLHQLTSFLQGDLIRNALTLKELIFGIAATGGGLFWLLRKLKGQKPNRIIDVGQGMVRVDIDGDSFTVPLKVLKLYQDLGVRNAVENTLKPLENSGIDTFEVKDGNTSIQCVNKADIRYFKTPVLEEQVILQDTRQIAYSIVSLSFREDNKWRLFDGSNTIHAALKDEAFLHKVEAGLISFTKGDMLICEVNITQKHTQAGLKMDYEIVKVLEHKTSPKQLSLDIEPEERA